jgi:hypothetical protein
VRRSKDRKDEPQSRPLGGGSQLADEAAERLATIVNAAERAAEQVIDDAEARARQILADAEAEGERIRGEALAAVDRARRELGALTAEQPGEQPPPTRGNHLSAVPLTEPAEPSPSPAAAAPEPDESSEQLGTPAGARLLATQMAVSGSSREEIELRLRNGFEIEDTKAILDAILGPEE